MSVLRAVRRARLIRICLALVVAIAMVIGVQQQGLGAVAKVRSDPEFTPRKDKPIKGRNAVPEPRPVDQADARALRGTPQVRWPDAGVAEVAVPQPGGDNAWTLALNGGRSIERAQAGNLPVWVAPTPAAARERIRTGVAASLPAKVKVESLGRRGDALLLKVQRTDGVDRAGRVVLGVDYRAFRDTFGGDWATRLRLVAAEGCEAVPAAGCRRTVIPTRNNGSGQLAAEIPVTAQPQTFAVAAGASSGAGDYKNSELTDGAATWSIGGSSGDFEWSLPLKVPPAIGGPQPTLGLQYSSGALDGLSSATNNQTSPLGQGFSLSGGGAIERRHKSCSRDKGGNNGTRETGDLCFAGDSLTISANGKSGSLVLDHRDASGEVWRMRGDDGSIVERFSGAANGDDGILASDKGEYWRMTSRDGTRFYFGLNRLPGWTAGAYETKSAWTVPIFGNHPGEQCNRAAFADSWCRQAYQWNLDYVVDRHGNTMSLFYDTETDNYARNATETAVSNYVRAGNLKRIEYGQRDGQVFGQKPVAQVLFTTDERCISPCGPSQPATYPDTPWDLHCASTTNCNNHYTPTFWTQKRLTKITTQVWRAASSKHEDVQSWTLRHEYLRGDNSGAALWLKAISPAGHVGPALQMPAIDFDGIALGNRVDSGSDMVPPLEWFRINAVHYGTGGDVSVNYEGIDCSPTSLPAPDNNDRRCRPQKWTPEGSAVRQDWYHKYVVKSVLETDRSVAANDPWQAPVPVTTTVQYLDRPAWRFEEQDAGTDLKDATWSQWRGFSKVRLVKGRDGEPKSVKDALYFRGMHGDRRDNGLPPKEVKVTDSTGVGVYDIIEFAGQSRERISYDGAAVENKSITDYWLSDPTATMARPWGTLTARRSGDKQLSQFQASDTGTLRISSKNSFDAAGRLVSKDEANDVSITVDDTCTRYEYAENPSKGLLELPARQQVVSAGCDEVWTNTDVITDERLFYDNATSLTAPPTRGVVTRAERLSGFDGNGKPTYEPVFTASYDPIGRQTTLTNALNQTVRNVYSPAYGPVTKKVETTPKGLEKATVYEPAWGEPITVTQPDGLSTNTELDALGRTAKVWKPGSPTSGAPDVEYSYLLRDNGASVVTTENRIDADTVDISYDLYDGLQRLRQTQEPTPAGGWLVTDYRYDSRGNKVKENGPYYTDVVAEMELKLVDENDLPKQELTKWNATEKPIAQIIKSHGDEKEEWQVAHDIKGNRQTIDPPAGQTPTTRILDPSGRLIELRQYLGDSPTGAYDKTTYSYWPSGQLKTVTDPAGNTWSYQYDVQGRKVKDTDPDKGIATYEYDGADRMVSSTDARGVKLAYAYDEDGRKTATHRDSLQGPRLAEWIYDTLAKGKPTSSTRYVGTNAYTTAITGYDTAGRPTGTSVTVPASEGRLGGTYTVGQTYTEDDQVKTRTLPQVGDLAQETLTYDYNDQGLKKRLAGLDTYVRNMEYNPFEQPHVLTRGTATGSWVEQSFEYDEATRRLSRMVTEKQTSPRRVSDMGYEYDPAGNVTKITDKPSTTSTEPTDTQCFSYDYLRRLTAAWTPAPGVDNDGGDCAATPTASTLGGPAPYFHKWTYDKTGNRKSEQRISPTGTTATSTYNYGANGKPHALESVTTSGQATKTFAYDATGNTSSRTSGGVSEILDWDEEGRLKGVTKGSVKSSFVYDADGNRLLRKDPSGTTLYLGETEVHLGTDGTTLTGTRYYSFDKQVVGVRTGGKLTWLIADLHGTPTIAIDSANQTVQRRRTTPFGEPRGTPPSSWPGQRAFHGGTSDPASGLIHLGAREYDQTTGRFISVDPVLDTQDPQQLNGYSYANNNPTSFDDSDGRIAIAVVVAVVVLVVYLAVAIHRYLVSFMQEVTTAVVRPIERSVVGFFSWLVDIVVSFVTVLITVFVEIFKWIEEVITELVTETRIEMRVEMRDIPEKKPPRNNQQKAKDNPAKPTTNTPKPPKGPKRPDSGKSNKGNKPSKDGRGSKEPAKPKEPKKPLTRADHERLEKLFPELGKDGLGKGRVDPWKMNTETRTPWEPPIKPNYDTKEFGSMLPKPGPGQIGWWTIEVTAAGVAIAKFFNKLGWLP